MSDSAFKIPDSVTGTDFATSVESVTNRRIPWNALAELNFPASTANSSTTNIAAGATFTGNVESGARQQSVQVAVFADQPYRLDVIQYSDDTGTRETARTTYTRNANEGVAESVLLVDWHFRVIVTNLNASAATTVFSCQTSQGVMPAGPKASGQYGGLPVEVYGRGEELRHYFASVAVIPTTLTTGLNYFWIRNTSSTKRIKIQKIEVIALFTGTAAASASNYLINKFTGGTATTGTALTVEKGNTAGAASVSDVKWSATGGTLTGATISGAAVASLGHANQVTSSFSYDRDMSDAPIVLGVNEGIVLRSNGAIVLGSTIHISVRWVEE